MMLHFLDKEDLVEKQDVGLVAVGAIVCNGHITPEELRALHTPFIDAVHRRKNIVKEQHTNVVFNCNLRYF